MLRDHQLRRLIAGARIHQLIHRKTGTIWNLHVVAGIVCPEYQLWLVFNRFCDKFTDWYDKNCVRQRITGVEPEFLKAWQVREHSNAMLTKCVKEPVYLHKTYP